MSTPLAHGNMRAESWYTKARFGLFHHWGLFTGGGLLQSHEHCEPLRYGSIRDFEAATGSPRSVASNMVGTARRMGARYITFTVLHTCDAYAVMYPTSLDGFTLHTTHDYVGALADECAKEGIELILYLPVDHKHWDVGGEWLAPEYRDSRGYESLLKAMVDELATRYGSRLSGFWLDGGHGGGMPEYIHSVLPDCVVIMNNDTGHRTPGTDVSTTEFLASDPNPQYNRPDGLRVAHPHWGVPPAPTDYNEDIPTCNGWWWQGPEGAGNPYVADPTRLVREMVSSLNQRGKWNFALGLGPLIDGGVPPEFIPMVDNVGAFLSWAGESIYGTVGGEYGNLVPGWWNNRAFGGVTVSPDGVHYAHVTTGPSTGRLIIPKRGGLDVVHVVDLASGNAIPFMQDGKALSIQTDDWTLVDSVGDKVLRIERI